MTTLTKIHFHYCPDWDYGAVWQGIAEYEACTCHKESLTIMDEYRSAARKIVDALMPEDMSTSDKGAKMMTVARILKEALPTFTMDVFAFHEKFGLTYHGHPRQLDRELHSFRTNFMQEELDEYVKAHEEGNLADQLDALCDLTYVVLGTAQLQGFPFSEAWARVQTANMSKINAQTAEDSKRGYAGDVVKPVGFKPPNHDDLVRPRNYDPQKAAIENPSDFDLF